VLLPFNISLPLGRAFRREIAIAALVVALGVASVRNTQAQQAAPEPTPSSQPTVKSSVPEIVVTAPKHKPNPKAAQRRPAPSPTDAATAAQTALDAKMLGLDQARDALLPKLGASTYTRHRFPRDTGSARFSISQRK